MEDNPNVRFRPDGSLEFYTPLWRQIALAALMAGMALLGLAGAVCGEEGVTRVGLALLLLLPFGAGTAVTVHQIRRNKPAVSLTPEGILVTQDPLQYLLGRSELLVSWGALDGFVHHTT